MATEHVIHSIPPTFDERSRVLVLGSVPSPKSREYGFNYGHPRNRFWQVLAKLADEPLPATVERKRDFCLRHHIALWDVVAECDIEGASDASIRNAQPNDLAKITAQAPIEAVFCTGSKAFELYRKLDCEKACGMPAIKLPSTSPANAQAKLDDLLGAYAQVLARAQAPEPPVVDVEGVRDLEQRIAQNGTSLAELMDRAGTALAYRVEAVMERLSSGTFPRAIEVGSSTAKTVAILCGNGNNGGDGWVAAQLLAERGYNIRLISAKAPEELRAQPARDAALDAWAAFAASGATVIEGDEPLPPDGDDRLPHPAIIAIRPSASTLECLMSQSCLVVDALLGIGFSGDQVKEPFGSWIRLANQTRAHHATIAVDVPSGLDAQTGASVESVEADETVTMIASKPGLSARSCGVVRVAPLAYIEPYI